MIRIRIIYAPPRGELADLRFMADVQKFGVEMIKVFDKEIQSFRRI